MMQAKFLVAVVMIVAESPANAAPLETFSCDVEPISDADASHIPSEISLRLLTDQRQAMVSCGGIEEIYGQPVLADVNQKSADSFVMRWEIERPGSLGGPAPSTVAYRAILNMRNLKIAISAFEPGGARVQQYGAGICADVGQ